VAEVFGKYNKITIVLIIAVLFLAGCAGDKSPSVYAVVDGVEITREDFNNYVGFLWFNPDVELTAEQELQVVDELIQVQVYTAEAYARGIQGDTDKATKDYESFRDQIIAGELFAGNATAFYARMQELGLSEEWVISVFEKFQVINSLIADEQEEEPDDEAITAYYEKEKEKLFAHGEMRKVRHILINKGNFPDASEDDITGLSEELAQEIYLRLVDGEDFVELAAEFSQDGSAQSGGDIGFIEKADVVKEFGDVAFSIEPGVIAEPVKSQHGWHILEVTEIREAGYFELDESIKDWIANAIQEERVDTLLARLMDEASIVNNLLKK